MTEHSGGAGSTRRRLLVRAGVAAALAGTLVGCSAAGAHRTSTSSSSESGGYGTLPTFLPSSAVRPDSTLTGTVASPALTTEGDAVAVRLADRSARVTVSGPVVPGEGLPYQASATTCTWTVTVTATSGAVPISVRDFTTLDHLGAVYHVAAVPGATPPPSVVPAGGHASFELRAVMPTGEGLMRWAPDGQHIVASWDFEVEND